jgi:hypothetical protein
MTKNVDHSADQAAVHDGATTAAEWFPVAHARLHVSRTVRPSPADVERMLRIQPELLLQLAYDVEAVGATGVNITLSPVKSQRWLRVPAHVEFWTPPAHHGNAIISLRWQAIHLSRYFPVLEADLSVRPGAGTAQIELDGTYRPPLRFVGLVFDHFVGKRIATVAAVGFVDAVCGAIDKGDLAHAETHT